jgi:hypothetical protein
MISVEALFMHVSVFLSPVLAVNEAIVLFITYTWISVWPVPMSRLCCFCLLLPRINSVKKAQVNENVSTLLNLWFFISLCYIAEVI